MGWLEALSIGEDFPEVTDDDVMGTSDSDDVMGTNDDFPEDIDGSDVTLKETLGGTAEREWLGERETIGEDFPDFDSDDETFNETMSLLGMEAALLADGSQHDQQGPKGYFKKTMRLDIPAMPRFTDDVLAYLKDHPPKPVDTEMQKQLAKPNSKSKAQKKKTPAKIATSLAGLALSVIVLIVGDAVGQSSRIVWEPPWRSRGDRLEDPLRTFPGVG
jgi:hypothetical protein